MSFIDAVKSMTADQWGWLGGGLVVVTIFVWMATHRR